MDGEGLHHVPKAAEVGQKHNKGGATTHHQPTEEVIVLDQASILFLVIRMVVQVKNTHLVSCLKQFQKYIYCLVSHEILDKFVKALY